MKRPFLLLFSGALIGIAAGIAFFFGFSQINLFSGINASSTSGLSESAAIYAPEKGKLAPEFTLENLTDTQVSLSDLRGKVVLLNFWATWCGPCRIEMPALQSRHEQYPDQLAVVGIEFDEPKKNVMAFVEEFELTFTILLDPGGEIQNAYRVRGYPTSVFLDGNGIVQIVHIGIMSEDQLDRYLQEMGVFE